MRRVTVLILSIMLIVCGGGVALATAFWGRTSISTAGEVDFATPLAIPPLASSKVDGSGRRVFDLTAAPGEHDFGGGPTRTWGFNGGYLGPTLRAQRGEEVIVNVHNGLAEPTTVHWHGMHLPARMDGGPHQAIQPGATWSPAWRIDQPAATLWYHPHPHGETARHVYRGLAGMFLIDDPAATGLPGEYGVDDIPVIVQDKKLTRGGDLSEGGSFLGDVGILGDTIAVNGTVGPYLDVHTERVRLRLLNASNARVYSFGFADGRKFALVGTDGGLLPQAVVKDSVEVWTVRNADGSPHNFHVHGVQFQVLSDGGGAPPPELSGWKDTIYLTPELRYELIMRLPSYADPAMPYMFHCHVLLHEDGGMMGQFAVVEPGQSAQTPHHH